MEKQLALLRLTAGNAKETELLNEHTCTKTRFSLVVFCMLVLLIHDTQHEATCEIHLSVLCNIQFNNRESSSFLLLQDFYRFYCYVPNQVTIYASLSKKGLKVTKTDMVVFLKSTLQAPFLAGFWMRFVYLCKKNKQWPPFYMYFFLVRFTEVKTMPQYFRLSSAEIVISWHIIAVYIALGVTSDYDMSEGVWKRNSVQ